MQRLYCAIDRICKSAEARGAGVSFFRKAARKSIRLNLPCEKQVGNIMCKRKKAGNCVAEVASKVSKVSTRKSVDSINWQVNCLFCGKPCTADKKNPERRLVFNVTFLHYRETILKYCSNRRNDKWSEDVKRKILSCNDLVHEDSRYHDDCQKHFTHLKNTEASSPRLGGKSRREVQQEDFIRLCEWLEGERDSFSVVELHEKMKKSAKSNEVYLLNWFKQK